MARNRNPKAASNPSPRKPPASSRASRRGKGGGLELTIYAIVRAIPRGRVATYGDIAKLADLPSGHRIVARAMRSCPESLPWYRVIGKRDARRGQINIGDGEHADFQRARLEAEGVEFDANGFVPLRRFGMLARYGQQSSVLVRPPPSVSPRNPRRR